MKNDPFGNLTDWGPVLDTLENLAGKGKLSQCQPGLTRILRYKGNWRLREEVLKHVGKIQTPSKELLHQVIAVLDDDNIYYDARIIASEALMQLLKHTANTHDDDLQAGVRKVIEKLKDSPQPPLFHRAIERLYLEITKSAMLEN
jgi:hypothetical protein